jgi:hypothetical protein
MRAILYLTFLLLLIPLATAQPVVITDNSVKMLWLLHENATLNDITTATGHTVLYNQSEFYTYLLPTTGNTWYGQSINETADYNMSGVVISLAESTGRYIRYANLTFTVRIETDNANKPSGTLAHVNATATLNATQILSNTYSAQYYQAATPFIFNSSINLTKNTTYWIVLKPSGGSGYEYFATGYGRTDRYPRGNLSSTTNAGTLWTIGINDLWFYVLTPTKNSSAITWNATNNTATLAAGWFIEVDGTGELVMNAGETLTGEVVAAGQYLRVGVFGGGLLSMRGTSTNYTNIFTPNNATTRKDYPVMVYYMGRMKADYANITGYASGANLYINAVYGGFQIRNSYIQNLYANSAGYPVALTAGMYSVMNNCTIIKSHASYPIYMTAYAGQGIVLINNNITTTSAYALAIYNTATITYASLSVVDNTFNGAPLGIGNITHVYSTGSTFIGHVISPRVIANGTPVANASVSARMQFDRNDLPNQLYGYGYTDRTVAWYPPATIGASSQYEYGTIAITDANGYPKDDLGLNNLWVVDTAYIGTAKTLYTYYGGSNASVRPMGYTWKNDGTDYGYIITATDGTRSKSVVVNPNATYTADMSLTTTTNLTKTMNTSTFSNTTTSNGCITNLNISVANASQSVVHNASESGTTTINNTYDYCQTEFITLGTGTGLYVDTTAEWDAGIKSNSSGNYEVETNTDNLNISDSWMGLGNKYSDRFTFPDADADTFKWTYSAYGDFLTNEVDIDTTVAGKLHFRVEYDEIGGTSGYIDAIVFQDTKIGGDFDIETKWSNWSIEGTANDWLCFGVFDINDSSSYTFDPVICRNYAGEEHFYIAYGGLTPAQVNTTDTDGRFRLTRAITSGTEATYDLYYWNNTGSNWELLLSEVFSTSDYVNALDDLYVGYWVETATDAGEVVINFDDFKVNSGTLVSSPYRTSGSWESPSISTAMNATHATTTINYLAENANACIDSVEWLVGGVSKATYATDSCNETTSLVIKEANLTSGSFNDINTTFTVRVNLTSDGASRIALDSINGDYDINYCPAEPTTMIIKQNIFPKPVSGSGDSSLLVGIIGALIGGVVGMSIVRKKRRD